MEQHDPKVGLPQFAVGDVVRLNSGGPRMTVIDTGGSVGDLTCSWFVGLVGDQAKLPRLAVTLVKTPSPGV